MPLPLPVPDLVSLDLLCSVADLGSIKRAADAHGISQPAASMRLRSLEKAVGVALLERGAGHARLTPAGEAVVQWSSEIISKVSSLLEGVRALRAEGDGTLTLAASMTVAEYLVPQWLSRLKLVDPEITASLLMGNSEGVLDIVRTERADIGFVEGSAVPSQFEQALVFSDDLVVVVSPGHPWANRKKVVTSTELAKTPLIMRESGSGTREVLHKALGAQGLSPVSLVELASNTALKSMVVSGVGPGVLSRLVTKAEVESGQLVIVRTRGLSLERSIRAVWLRGRKPSQAARRLLEVAAGVA